MSEVKKNQLTKILTASYKKIFCETCVKVSTFEDTNYIFY